MANTVYKLGKDLRLGLLPDISEQEDPTLYSNMADVYNAIQQLAAQISTLEGASQRISTAIATTISVISTFYTLAGTYTTEDLELFDSPANGQLRALGVTSKEFVAFLNFEVQGTAGDVISLRLRKYEAATATTSTLFTSTKEVINFASVTDAVFFNFVRNITLDPNDYVFIEVANTSGTNNVTAALDSYLTLTKR